MKRKEFEEELKRCQNAIDKLEDLCYSLKWVIDHPSQINILVEPEWSPPTGTSVNGISNRGYDSSDIFTNTCNGFFQTAIKLQWYNPSNSEIKHLVAVVVRDATLKIVDNKFNKETGEFECTFKVNGARIGKQTFKYKVNLYAPINKDTIKLSTLCPAGNECPAVIYHFDGGNRIHI